MGQTFRWWRLRSLHPRTAVDGRAVERAGRGKQSDWGEIIGQRDHAKGHRQSQCGKQEWTPGPASELRASGLGASGLSDENGCQVLAFDVSPFYFFFIVWLYYVLEPKDWRWLFRDIYFFTPFYPGMEKRFDTGLDCRFLFPIGC